MFDLLSGTDRLHFFSTSFSLSMYCICKFFCLHVTHYYPNGHSFLEYKTVVPLSHCRKDQKRFGSRPTFSINFWSKCIFHQTLKISRQGNYVFLFLSLFAALMCYDILSYVTASFLLYYYLFTFIREYEDEI